MRIAVWNNLPSGGGQRALFDHVQGLIARGHSIEVWSPPTADNSLLDVRNLAPHHLIPFEPSGKRIAARFPHIDDLFLGAYLRAFEKHCQAVSTQIDQSRFDVLLSSTCMKFAAPPLGRYVSIPSILYLQEPRRRLYEAPNIWALRHRSSSIKDILRSGFDIVKIQRLRQQVREEIDNAAAFDQILVNSRFSAESVARAYGLPSRVCYLGVNPELWQFGSARPGRMVVGIGTIARHKRIDFVLGALGATAPPHPSLRWIGNRSDELYLNELVEQANDLGIDFKVSIAATHETMLAILRDASLLAYAPRLEPFGYAPLECGAGGLATVAVAEGGIRETVVDGISGLLVQDDIHEMAVAISKLIDDPLRSAELGMAAREMVLRRWTIEGAVDRLESELHRVMSAGRTHDPEHGRRSVPAC